MGNKQADGEHAIASIEPSTAPTLMLAHRQRPSPLVQRTAADGRLDRLSLSPVRAWRARPPPAPGDSCGIERPTRPLRRRPRPTIITTDGGHAMPTGSRGKSATLTINPHNQNLDTVHRLVGHILGQAGCAQCGRIAVLKIDFLGDPPSELGKEGVISVEMLGF
jgi:hypothetical protein